MAITALPEATIHLLGSAQVLTTPTSLIKELVDNSLDARATSINILVSSNTLDKLEVRDNGHGIPQEDLNALGRRGHTSKLRSFEELKFLGGVTLGFRGEALASAVQLGEVSITTRTDAESIANKVKLEAPGRIEDQSHTSHPVGTTVSVLNFMAKLPVRKKTFEKEAAKTLVKINELLRAYALARPFIKFSLKVTKSGKGSWSYVPRPNGDIRAAVSQGILPNHSIPMSHEL
jgi:DNA mismatch repair protein MutL